MRALLVNPWIYDFAAYDLWSKPLGLLNIAAHLKGLGCEVSLVDCLDAPRLKTTQFGSGFYYSQVIEKPAGLKNIPRKFKRYGMSLDLFKKIIEERKRPDVILVTSGMTYWYPGVFEAIRILKEAFAGVPIVLGGIYVNLCFTHAKDKGGADFVYRGNKIDEILELISKITGNKMTQSGRTEQLFPAYDLYPELKYVTLRTSTGCPFKCSYCGWYLLEEKISRQDTNFVIREIEYFYKTRGIKNFAFYDEALLYDAQKHVIIILKELIRRKIKANFHTPNGLHTKFITRELALLLKAAGFVQPRLALETTCEKRQAETGQKTTNMEFLNALECLNEAGYASREIAVNIMIGLPDQPLDEIKESIRFAASKGVRIFLEEYSPIPGTPDYLKTGLAQDADPLLHNNSIFPAYQPAQQKEFQALKTFTNELNKKI